MSSDAKFGLVVLVIFVAVIVFIIWGVPAIDARACTELARDIERDTKYVNGACWVKACPDVWLRVMDLEYHLDLIQDCAAD